MNPRIVALIGLAFMFAASLVHAVTLAHGFDRVGPSQSDILRNQQASAAGANSIVIAAVTNKRVRLYSFSGTCASGAASVTIANGATIVWTGTGVLSTTFNQVNFPVPLTGSTGVSMTILASNCFGGGGASTLNVVADQY